MKPWIEETGFDIQAIETRVIEAETHLVRLREKGNFHIERKTPVLPEVIADHESVQAELEALDKDVSTLEKDGGRFEDLVGSLHLNVARHLMPPRHGRTAGGSIRHGPRPPDRPRRRSRGRRRRGSRAR